MKIKLISTALAFGMFFSGCDVCVVDRDPYWRYDNCNDCYCDRTPPPIPRGVHSVTRDRSVYIYWNPVVSCDFQQYAVYRGYSPTGYYSYIGSTRSANFTDYNLTNGITYYYAISSIDYCGNESELSTDLVFDTPRPEGHSYYLWSAEYYPNDAGFDFSHRAVVPFDYPTCDVYFGHDALGYYLCAGNDYTDIIDMGYANSLYDIDRAPETGWSPYADVEARERHAYVIWTADNHFAVMLIRHIYSERMTFDWAYQTAPGNPELKIVRPKPMDRKTLEYRRVKPSQINNNIVVY